MNGNAVPLALLAGFALLIVLGGLAAWYTRSRRANGLAAMGGRPTAFDISHQWLAPFPPPPDERELPAANPRIGQLRKPTAIDVAGREVIFAREVFAHAPSAPVDSTFDRTFTTYLVVARTAWPGFFFAAQTAEGTSPSGEPNPALDQPHALEIRRAVATLHVANGLVMARTTDAWCWRWLPQETAWLAQELDALASGRPLGGPAPHTRPIG